jgi:hypothetical protein
VEIVCDGVLTFAERLAQAAEQRAQNSADETAALNCMRMAADLRTVPAEPARTFAGTDHGVVCAPDSTDGEQRAFGVAGAL